MAKADYEGRLYTASFPAHIDDDGRDYLIFQLLNAQGVAVDPVFYRDMALNGSLAIARTVFEAVLKKHELKVYLDPVAGPARVRTVKLGAAY